MDTGVIAYSEDRFEHAAANEDGLFIDSQGSGDLKKNIKGSVSYSDPFGLCPNGLSESQQSNCEAIETAMTILGAIGGGIKGGAEGALVALPTGETVAVVTIPIGAALEGAAGAAAGKLAGMALTNVLFSSGHNSRTTARTKIGKQSVRVDAELPTDHSPGDVHVQTKGPGGPQKFRVPGVDELSGLPKAIRENSIIQRGIEKAFDLINRFQR